ncbi:hypothetical protein DIJ64_13405 [Mycobacterium leprae]|uniref:Uncharacterized protein n=2 Tax=Mycobacterium leprae TaxID=1769 RepID=A0AAD0P7I7_MYCLR|nr:hypothetical protein [Mycobacterium leprae]AWV48697.1 hypothetical protein DIJ64_13405 [Mycobacterium leprae]OAR20432.1 hypothetical protein A8144_10715 [Mycobacterium leprae 3125609]OAX70723.1 hypothetical protein A3216_10185 [Mycobacterium leprae 7935681]
MSHHGAAGAVLDDHQSAVMTEALSLDWVTVKAVSVRAASCVVGASEQIPAQGVCVVGQQHDHLHHFDGALASGFSAVTRCSNLILLAGVKSLPRSAGGQVARRGQLEKPGVHRPPVPGQLAV